jgi:hypothetical protein
MNLRPDPTFHATPKLAMQAPVEKYAFTVMLSPDGSQSDGIAVIDLDQNQTPMARSSPGHHAQQGRRVSPFRLERLFVIAVAALRPCLSGAALPDRARHPLVDEST